MDDRLIKMLKKHEGFIDHIYKCPAGKNTIGYGHNCDAHKDLAKFQGRKITEEEATQLLIEDAKEAEAECKQQIRDFDKLTSVQQAVLVDMCFNMGIYGLLKFKNTLALIRADMRKEAAAAMKQSLWHRQVGARALRLEKMIEEDSWDSI